VNRVKSRSVAGALLLSWFIPGAGQVYLGERHKGLRMMALFSVIAIPTWTIVIAHGDVFPAAIGIPPAMVVWIWSQRDIRRTLRRGWRPLLPTWAQTIDAIKGRDRLYPDDPLTSDPERPTQDGWSSATALGLGSHPPDP